MATSRSSALELFTVGGITVEIDVSWLVIFFLILWSLSAGYFPVQYPGYSTANYWIVGFVATILFFASVLGHEMCHAAMGNYLGERVSRITLFIFGGMAQLEKEPTNAWDELRIAAVGPISSLIFALIFWLIARAIGMSAALPLWEAVFIYLAFINLALALFNLLPGFPLDGGRLLRAILWQRWGDLRRATARAADWGNTIAWGLIILGAMEIFAGALIGGLWLIFIGLFLRSAASSGYQTMIVDQALAGTRVSDIMIANPITLGPGTTIADAIENYFLRYGYGGFPVAEDEKIEGVISLSQVRHCPPDERASRRVRDLMRPLDESVEISPAATVSDAIHRMTAQDLGRLLVMDQSRLLGLVTRTGIARFVQTKAQLTAPTGASESSNRGVQV
jgi:Zn-dependent protease/CBS domain-containing protein